MKDISLLIGLKNTLDYTKKSYYNIRNLYPNIEICYVSFGSEDGTHEWLEEISKTDKNIKYFCSQELKTLSDTYNKAASIATKEYVVFLHNDIILAPLFIENIIKHINKNTIVSYTTIEPPIFAGHERDGKIIKDFGGDLKSFNIDSLFTFIEKEQSNKKDKVSNGWAFFCAMNTKLFLDMGGLDNLYAPMFCEDDDFYIRLKMQENINFIVSLDAICYHFVSKTSRFSEEFKYKTQKIELSSNRNFIRKWGCKNFKAKYDIGYVITNCNINLIPILELFATTIYVDCPYSDYIKLEQENTKFNLSNRIKNINDDKKNDILIYFDANTLNESNLQLLEHFSEIILDSGELGLFELDIFKIEILKIKEVQKNFIQNNNPYYQNQLL